MAVKPKYIGAN